MFHRRKHFFILCFLSLVLGTGQTGCHPEHKGVSLHPEHGARINQELEIPTEKQGVTRVEWTAGGSSNPCLPTSKLAVLGDGTVFCWRKAMVNEQCPAPFKYTGSIPAQEAQMLVKDTRDELRASDPASSEGCAGGWGSIALLDHEERRYFSIDLSCQGEALMQQNRQRLHEIWRRVCDGNVGPQEG